MVLRISRQIILRAYVGKSRRSSCSVVQLRLNAQGVAGCSVVVWDVSIREHDARRDVGRQARPTNRINHTRSLARIAVRSPGAPRTSQGRSIFGRKLLTLIPANMGTLRRRAKSRTASSVSGCEKKRKEIGQPKRGRRMREWERNDETITM